MTTGQKIYELRKSARITQEQFAEKLEVSRQAVSKWESDTAYPETDKIIKIAELFGVSCDYLLKDGVEAAEGRLSPPRRALFKMLVTIGVACCAVGYVVAIICYYCIDMRESPLIGLGVLVAFLLAALILWQAGRYRFLNGCDYTEADKSHLCKNGKGVVLCLNYRTVLLSAVGCSLRYYQCFECRYGAGRSRRYCPAHRLCSTQNDGG